MLPGQVTPGQIVALRLLVDEPDDAEPYTDAELSQMIADQNGNINAAAYYIWVNKAAALSTMVDITEGGSTRRQSQAFTNAQEMVKHFQNDIPSTDPDSLAHFSRTRAIERP